MTIQQALTRATGQLSAHPQLRPRALPDAAYLLQHALQLTRASLIAHPERSITRDQQAAYQALLERRLAFEPIQHITGTQEFYGLTLHVTPDVLIPRPETELLVEAVIARLQSTPNARIVDVGTGSGAIALALAANLPRPHITALDISPAALEIARRNAASLGLDIRLLHSDLLTTVESEPLFDAIVSNPPYIPVADASTLHPEVSLHEPHQALFAGSDGLDLYRRLIPAAFTLLVPGGLLALEIGFGQQPAIAELLAGSSHAWSEILFLDDLQSIPRVALARRPSS